MQRIIVVMLGLLVTIFASNVPERLKPYVKYAWLLIVLLLFIVLVLWVKKVRQKSGQPANPGRPHAQLPSTIYTHVAHLYRFTLQQLGTRSGIQFLELEDIRRRLAQRTAVAPHTPERRLILPEAVLQAAGLHERRNRVFDQLLIVADAGEGKTTMALWLVCELADRALVKRRWRLVPMLVDCAALYQVFAKEDDSQDEVLLAENLALAIAPRMYDKLDAGHAIRRELEIQEFSAELKQGGLELLLVLDGLDELDPSATTAGCARVERLLLALASWQSKHGIDTCYLIATSRPYFEGIESLTGMRKLEMQKPAAHEVSRLAHEYDITGYVLDRFRDAFQNPKEIDSKLVYFRPLARFFSKYGADTVVSRLRLMEFEVNHAIDETIDQVRREKPAGINERAEIIPCLRNLLVRVALKLLEQQDPARQGGLTLSAIVELAKDEGLERVATYIQSERLARKILGILIPVGVRDPDKSHEEYEYRLPHNEYRDALLADGLFRLILNQNPPGGEATAADLARAYRRAEGVRDFLDDMFHRDSSDSSITWHSFQCNLVLLMNNRLPSEDPEERADVSPHGAMLSLLLSKGAAPSAPALTTKGVNFHGAVASAKTETLIKISGNKDWTGAVLREADLRGADFSKCDLTQANLDNARLEGCDLTSATLVGANLRNISMGRYHGLPTRLTDAVFDHGDQATAADWFNYRFQCLTGYFCFWDMEPVLSDRYVLVAGSCGRLLLFEPAAEDWGPRYLQTEHLGTDDILDVSSHPTKNLIVTASRDKSVRLHQLPTSSPERWPATNDDGVIVHPLKQVCELQLTHLSNYPRRARFSKSGRWLAVATRDPHMLFYNHDLGARDPFGQYSVGRAHTGPVMCVDTNADADPLYQPSQTSLEDRFFTAGYDGRIVMWTEQRDADKIANMWRMPLITKRPAATATGERTIVRALITDTISMGGLWAGAEDGRLRYYKVEPDDLVEDSAFGYEFESAVFALAINAPRALLAVGLASGAVLVYQTNTDGSVNWACPRWKCPTGDEIVRALLFPGNGQQLLATTWDARLLLFSLKDDQRDEEGLGATKTFEYPEGFWQPERDIGKIVVDMKTGLGLSRGISSRMKHYLQLVGQASEERKLHAK